MNAVFFLFMYTVFLAYLPLLLKIDISAFKNHELSSYQGYILNVQGIHIKTISKMFVLSIFAGVVLIYVLFRDVRINAKY